MTKFAFIGQYKGSLTQSRLCQLFNVTDRGFRAWRSRPISLRQREDMVLLAHIGDQFKASLQTYGRPRMTEELQELGF